MVNIKQYISPTSSVPFFFFYLGWHSAYLQFLGEEFCKSFSDGYFYAYELEIFANSTVYVAQNEDEGKQLPKKNNKTNGFKIHFKSELKNIYSLLSILSLF